MRYHSQKKPYYITVQLSLELAPSKGNFPYSMKYLGHSRTNAANPENWGGIHDRKH